MAVLFWPVKLNVTVMRVLYVGVNLQVVPSPIMTPADEVATGFPGVAINVALVSGKRAVDTVPLERLEAFWLSTLGTLPSPTSPLTMPVGAVMLGAVPKTAGPVPVSSVRQPRRLALDAVPSHVAQPVASPVTLPIAGVHVVCDAAVASPLALYVTVVHCVAEPKLPTLALTVASVNTPVAESVASPDIVRHVGSVALPSASCPDAQSNDV